MGIGLFWKNEIVTVCCNIVLRIDIEKCVNDTGFSSELKKTPYCAKRSIDNQYGNESLLYDFCKNLKKPLTKSAVTRLLYV